MLKQRGVVNVLKHTLKELRIARHLTQDEVARQLGLSKSTISMYENGRREPDLDTLGALAELYQVDINQLLGRRTPADEATVTDEQIKFALFSGDPCVTDEMYEEVKRYADYIRQKHRQP